MGRFGDWFWGVETRSDVPPETNSGDNHLARIAPAREASPLAVSADAAMSLSTVYRAISILGTAATQLSLDVYRANKVVPNVPLFIRQPNASVSQRAFIESTVTSLAIDGNAFWRVDRDGSGKVLNVEVLDPRQVQIDTDASQNVLGYRYVSSYFKPDQIRHLRLLRVPGQIRGLGPIQAAQRELRGAIDTRDYSSNWFRDSGIPSGVLKTDQALTAESARQARDSWEESRGGIHGTAVLGAGLGYQTILLSPEEAQFVSIQKFSTTQVARLYGIPASMLLADIEGTSQTYANVQQAWTEFTRFSLSAYVSEIEDALSSLVPGLGIVRANYEGLLRADTTVRYAAHAVAIGSGWKTPNEVRADEGLAPLTGGDVLKPTATSPVAPTPEGTK